MDRLIGYKGLLFNILLFGAVSLLGILLDKVNRSAVDYDMPMYIIIIFTALIPFENSANQYLITHEFQKMNEVQIRVWQKFSKTYFFGLLLLMLVIWRTYFKMELLIMPIFYEVYNWLGLNYKILTWKGKIPVYLAGSLIVYGELILLGHTLIPGKIKANFNKELGSKVVVLLSATFFTMGLLLIFKPYFGNIHQNNVMMNLPVLIIVFVFFYIPLRWVEIISDVIDCQNRWQLWLFWLSSFAGMVMLFKS
ncbi:MAG: hypothetical protein IPM42_20720 [Saprospiraceae bacterium]|nr:hypothetical protein [Saprospiraceae bacterium]